MPRYITRNSEPQRAFDDELWSDMPFSMTVHELDEEGQETGLLDMHGNPLYRVEERAPLGFDTRPRYRVKAGSRRIEA